MPGAFHSCGLILTAIHKNFHSFTPSWITQVIIWNAFILAGIAFSTFPQSLLLLLIYISFKELDIRSRNSRRPKNILLQSDIGCALIVFAVVDTHTRKANA